MPCHAYVPSPHAMMVASCQSHGSDCNNSSQSVGKVAGVATLTQDPTEPNKSVNVSSSCTASVSVTRHRHQHFTPLPSAPLLMCSMLSVGMVVVLSWVFSVKHHVIRSLAGTVHTVDCGCHASSPAVVVRGPLGWHHCHNKQWCLPQPRRPMAELSYGVI